jgi:hypothetical protein
MLWRKRTTTMSLISDAAAETGTGEFTGAGPGTSSSFRFVPRELAIKCRTFIESYHAMHGYAQLADMLWHSDARDLIDCQPDLAQIFKKASKSRCAKRTNDSLLLVATVIASVEVLARDFAGWGKMFPHAKRAAEAMLVDFPVRRRTWFIDLYLYPSIYAKREIAGALAPSASEQVLSRN